MTEARRDGAGDTTGLEQLLITEAAVTEAQLERARRIAARMEHAGSVGEILVELGQLARAELERVQRLHRSTLSLANVLHDIGTLDDEGLRAYQIARAEDPKASDRSLLVDGGLVTEEEFLRALSSKHDIPYVEPEIALIDKNLLDRTSIPYLQRQRVLPLRIVDDALHAILTDPLDEQLIEDLERIFEINVAPCCAPRAKILEALGNLEQLRDASADDHIVDLQYRENDTDIEEEGGEGAVRIVDYLLLRAIESGASDLHIEPLESKLRVRIRVDGTLRQLTELPIDFAPRIAARIKVLASADITERRLHQDGRIFVRTANSDIDLRVSTYVSMFGETLVMRILDRQRGLIPLDGLGYQPRVLAILMEYVLRASSGLVLSTGPTGSGKTTSLYSFIDYVKDGARKIITCEDPVEFVLEGITQCSVNEKTGPTFSDSLRAIVRQDPDIVVVGEIRDATTADLAIQAALTGHKVFSTFHTEDSVGAVIRLLEMGIEPFLVASTLSCVVAQRLVRKLCSSCQEVYEPSQKDMRFLSVTREELHGIPLTRGAGCSECDGAGYSGRLGVYELMWPNDDFRDAILRRASTEELRSLARQLPAFLTLQEDGLLKVVSGQTTLSEIVDHVPRDANARRLAVLQEIATRRR